MQADDAVDYMNFPVVAWCLAEVLSIAWVAIAVNSP